MEKRHGIRAALVVAIDFFRSQEAILAFIFVALLAQLPHTAVVFQRLSTTDLTGVVMVGSFAIPVGAMVEWLHAYLAAIAVEFAVLIFVVRGKTVWSWLFAASSICMNMIYYWQPEWSSLKPGPQFDGAILWSAVLPIAIALYSHEIGDGKAHDKLPFRERLMQWWAYYPAKKPATKVTGSTPAPTGKPVTPIVSAPAPVSNGYANVPTNGATSAPAVTNGAVGANASAGRNGHSGSNGGSNGVAHDVFVAGASVVAVAAPALNGIDAGAITDGVTTKWQQVYNMRENGMEYNEIAEQLGITANAARGYYKKAKDRLQARQGVGQDEVTTDASTGSASDE